MKFLLGYITTKDKKEAEKIATCLLKEKLVACVNIIDNISSIYWWKHKIQHDNESLLIIKTKENLAEEIIKNVKKNHSYQCPEIIFYEIKKGNKDYLNWINKSTK